MSRSKTVSPSDTFSPDTRARIDARDRQVAVQQGSNDNGSIDYNAKLVRVFKQFVSFDHGYYKLRSEESGDAVHLAFTWTQGKHHGSYVYVRCTLGDITDGMEILWRKVSEVEAGERLPTPDRRNANYRPTSYGK